MFPTVFLYPLQYSWRKKQVLLSCSCLGSSCHLTWRFVAHTRLWLWLLPTMFYFLYWGLHLKLPGQMLKTRFSSGILRNRQENWLFNSNKNTEWIPATPSGCLLDFCFLNRYICIGSIYRIDPINEVISFGCGLIDKFSGTCLWA